MAKSKIGIGVGTGAVVLGGGALALILLSRRKAAAETATSRPTFPAFPPPPAIEQAREEAARAAAEGRAPQQISTRFGDQVLVPDDLTSGARSRVEEELSRRRETDFSFTDRFGDSNFLEPVKRRLGTTRSPLTTAGGYGVGFGGAHMAMALRDMRRSAGVGQNGDRNGGLSRGAAAGVALAPGAIALYMIPGLAVSAAITFLIARSAARNVRKGQGRVGPVPFLVASGAGLALIAATGPALAAGAESGTGTGLGSGIAAAGVMGVGAVAAGYIAEYYLLKWAFKSSNKRAPAA